VTAGWVDMPEENLRAGEVDDAQIEAAWYCWANPSAGRLVTFTGKLGEISWNEAGFEASIVSFMKQLERNIGWTYTSSCRHQLYDQPAPGRIGACMVDPAPFTFTGTVSAINIPKWQFEFTGTALGKGETYFSSGQITFTSGLNNGLSTIIKSHEVGSTEVFKLFLPTAFVIPVGTTFIVKAGCDKTFETCKAKFNNVLNHGGFPHINPNVNLR
jgi:uncharacterized phage protein (TIGR02218 family)